VYEALDTFVDPRTNRESRESCEFRTLTPTI